jgi:hypothetical protein
MLTLYRLAFRSGKTPIPLGMFNFQKRIIPPKIAFLKGTDRCFFTSLGNAIRFSSRMPALSLFTAVDAYILLRNIWLNCWQPADIPQVYVNQALAPLSDHTILGVGRFFNVELMWSLKPRTKFLNIQVVEFFFQVGQTQKAFEHLGNALTYDPTFAKVRDTRLNQPTHFCVRCHPIHICR